MSGQEVLGRLDGDEQVGGEQRGPQGAASWSSAARRPARLAGR